MTTATIEATEAKGVEAVPVAEQAVAHREFVRDRLVALRCLLSESQDSSPVGRALYELLAAYLDDLHLLSSVPAHDLERLIGATQAWLRLETEPTERQRRQIMVRLDQPERVPQIFRKGEFFGCARNEAGRLFLDFDPEELPDTLHLLSVIKLVVDNPVGVFQTPDQRAVRLARDLIQAARSALIKNGTLAGDY